LEVFNNINTANIIPVAVNVKIIGMTQYGFKSSRFLVDIIKALQMTFQDSYIAPIDPNDTITECIAHYTMVPLENDLLQKYMTTPISAVNNTVFLTTIIIHAKKKLKDFSNEQIFCKYILSEQITLSEYNNLNTVKYTKKSEKKTKNKTRILPK
jgi:hypothetical protein